MGLPLNVTDSWGEIRSVGQVYEVKLTQRDKDRNRLLDVEEPSHIVSPWRS
jgi:hypothetical protein